MQLTESDEPVRHEARPYDYFGAAYASGAERTFSEAMTEYVLSRVARPARVLDVACGLGAACERFASRGITAEGVDGSSTMVRIARLAAESRELAISYSRADMRDLGLGRRFDLITCMYDSLNFMVHEADLVRALLSARGHLDARGMYAFDVYTHLGLETTWGHRAEVHTSNDDHIVVTTTTWDPDQNMNIKEFYGFSRQASGWGRWSERHVVRSYDMTRMAAAIAASGLRIVDIVDWNDGSPIAPHPGTLRLVYFTEPAHPVQEAGA
jgi:SAM-dependent methyltransferase